MQYYVRLFGCSRRRAWMRPVATVGVALPICVLVTIVSPAKVAEWIEMPFGGADSCDCRYSVLDGGAHWCYMAKITDPSVWRRRCVRSLPLL